MPSVLVHPPLQLRSRRTLDKIARAVEVLLETRSFDDIGVADIVRQARCSTGSFYARFDSKDALLPYLYERYDADLRPRIAAREASLDWAALSLRETVDTIIGTAVDMYVERSHLLRAVALYARAHPRAIGDDVRERRGGMHDLLAKKLARFGAQVTHDDALAAARIGLFIAFAAARDMLLFGEAPHATATRMSAKRLTQELSRSLFAYLTCR